MTHKHLLRGSLLFLGIAMAPAALAYLSPEDVLLNKELYLPPTQREAADRVDAQTRESAERREREQEILFKAQRSSESSSFEAVPMPAEGNGAAPEQYTGSFSPEDLRLLQTIRLLDRVQRNQQVVLYGDRLLPMQVDTLHGGAPLAPTGAGGILSGLTMVGAVGWTLLRARKGKVIVER
ncbi:hypothetical protein AUJ46_01675 [Candidatus Peregrinibacteria bacterium CG1_02_54_53]|nr:MAG: hypothetical protein AUJ46_01675 [Candidatus Peregrinibacteria bacterium CG1_02_54_53]